MSQISVVDFREYGLMKRSAEKARQNTEAFSRIVKELFYPFQNVGFVYLVNTGLQKEQLDNVFKMADAFFSLTPEAKSVYALKTEDLCGWISLEKERNKPARPGDLNESFYVSPFKSEIWPTKDVPGFKDAVCTFFSSCTELALRVLDVISCGLKLERPDQLRNNHDISNNRTETRMRIIHYSSLARTEVKPGEIRLSEHTDLGSITLLFQDQAGGLEVQCRDGIYRPATPIPGTVLVNIGDLMQRWSSDVLLSNRHRVVLPKGHEKEKIRRSVAFFVIPNDDCIIECLDGSNKYPPVNAKEYITGRMKTLYKTN